MPETKWHQSIGFKIILSVAATAVLVNVSFGYLYLTIQEEHLGGLILKSASSLSETIKKSIKFDMLENRKENAYRIMKTIGEQDGIAKVRIFSREGKILFSTDDAERGTLADKRGEACTACHSEEKPLERLTTTARSRIFRAPDGQRVLGMINPMYNEAGCDSPGCHANPASQKILGVIDVTMSLAEVDREIAEARNQIVFFNILSILTLSAIVVVLVIRLVDNPVRNLVLGTNRVAAGDLGHAIPVDGDDEMALLARSFNNMTEKLARADAEMKECISDLEKKFEERTTELKEAQAHLLHSEKLAALGKIAATVAHEINNPLAGVFTYIKLMERKIDGGRGEPGDIAKYKEYLATMGREVERTSAIVLNLLDFTRPKEPRKKSVNINVLIEESILIVRNKLATHGIDIGMSLGAIPDIHADPSQVKQVFINILVNACEAMEGGGSIAVSSRYEEAGRSAVVEFRDTGPGIPPEIRSRIFDPFFTTKEKGTGLGLSVAHGIVRRHDGRLDVTSSPEEGTLMRIVLPSGT